MRWLLGGEGEGEDEVDLSSVWSQELLLMTLGKNILKNYSSGGYNNNLEIQITVSKIFSFKGNWYKFIFQFFLI